MQLGMESENFKVERKVFWLVWKGVTGRNLLSIEEQGRRKTFRSFLTKDGGFWLADRMRRAVEELGDYACTPSEISWRDDFSTMVAEIQNNAGGSYLRVEIAPSSSRTRSVNLCFPAGHRGEGWSVAASAIEKILSGKSAIPNSEGNFPRIGVAPGRVPGAGSYMDVLRGHTDGAEQSENRDGNLTPIVVDRIHDLKILITLKVEDFSMLFFSNKLKKLELWADSCKKLGGFWKSTWEDESSLVEISMNCPAAINISTQTMAAANTVDGIGMEEEDELHEQHEPHGSTVNRDAHDFCHECSPVPDIPNVNIHSRPGATNLNKGTCGGTSEVTHVAVSEGTVSSDVIPDRAGLHAFHSRHVEHESNFPGVKSGCVEADKCITALGSEQHVKYTRETAFNSNLNLNTVIDNCGDIRDGVTRSAKSNIGTVSDENMDPTESQSQSASTVRGEVDKDTAVSGRKPGAEHGKHADLNSCFISTQVSKEMCGNNMITIIARDTVGRAEGSGQGNGQHVQLTKGQEDSNFLCGPTSSGEECSAYVKIPFSNLGSVGDDTDILSRSACAGSQAFNVDSHAAMIDGMPGMFLDKVLDETNPVQLLVDKRGILFDNINRSAGDRSTGTDPVSVDTSLVSVDTSSVNIRGAKGTCADTVSLRFRGECFNLLAAGLNFENGLNGVSEYQEPNCSCATYLDTYGQEVNYRARDTPGVVTQDLMVCDANILPGVSNLKVKVTSGRPLAAGRRTGPVSIPATVPSTVPATFRKTLRHQAPVPTNKLKNRREKERKAWWVTALRIINNWRDEELVFAWKVLTNQLDVNWGPRSGRELRIAG